MSEVVMIAAMLALAEASKDALFNARFAVIGIALLLGAAILGLTSRPKKTNNLLISCIVAALTFLGTAVASVGIGRLIMY